MRLLFDCLLTLVVVAATCHCYGQPVIEYLQIGTNPHVKELRWIVDQIESGGWGHDAESIAENLKLVRTLALNASLYGVDSIRDKDTVGVSAFQGSYYWLNNALSDLVAFSNPDFILAACSNNEVRTFLAVVELKFGDLKTFAESLSSGSQGGLLFRYLQEYGKRHSAECLGSLVGRLEGDLKRLESDTEKKLDVMVAMGEEYLAGMVDMKLATKAKKLHLATGQFDAAQMLSSLKNHIYDTRDEKWVKFVESTGLLTTVIEEVCGDLRLKMPFDMYNLARLLAPEAVDAPDLPVKFLKLNEYSRICIPFYKRSSKKEAQTNVINNLIRNDLDSRLS